MKTYCDFCGAEVEYALTREGFALIGEHERENPKDRCPAVGQVQRPPSPPADCPACGEPLSLRIRSRPTIGGRHHGYSDCVRALRARIEKLEKASHTHDGAGPFALY